MGEHAVVEVGDGGLPQRTLIKFDVNLDGLRKAGVLLEHEIVTHIHLRRKADVMVPIEQGPEIQVFDGDGHGGPTEAELLAREKDRHSRRLKRAIKLLIDNKMKVNPEDYLIDSYPAGYPISDGVLIVKMEKHFGPMSDDE